jgi:hypothetical protein
MATLPQNQELLVTRVQALDNKMDQKFAEMDRRFEHIESLLQKMFAELPESVFGFGKAAQKKTRLFFVN